MSGSDGDRWMGGGGRLINVASRPSLNIFSQGQPLKGHQKPRLWPHRNPHTRERGSLQLGVGETGLINSKKGGSHTRKRGVGIR